MTAELTTTIEFGTNRYRTILRLAMPTVVAMLSQSVVNEIDVVFFARLPSPEGSNGQAALLPSLIILWFFGGSLCAVSVGAQALTARRYAEGDCRGAGAVLTNAAWFSLLAGAAASLLGYLLIPIILSFPLKGDALRIGIDYSRWRLLGVTSMVMTMGIKAFFDGIGKTHVHLVAAIIMNAFNVLFCWLLIYGNASLGVPRMGPPGAGLSAFIATWIGLLIMLLYVKRIPSRFETFRRAHLSRTLTWSILKLSIPAGLATMTMMVGFYLFTLIVGMLDGKAVLGGAEAVNGAATTDIVEVLKLTFTACIAFGTSTATLVGQSLGMKRPDEASAFGWASVRLGIAIFGVVGLCEGLLFTSPIVTFISHSPAVQAAATMPLRMVGFITPIVAVAMILSEALFGAGETIFVAIAQLLLVFGCLLPMAGVLGVLAHFGLFGVWLSACVYMVLAAITMTVKFRGGAWKHIRL